jgi:hypothetical protein
MQKKLLMVAITILIKVILLKWFDQMEEFVLTNTGYSYFDGTACHLDLIQWATDPVWSSELITKDVQKYIT